MMYKASYSYLDSGTRNRQYVMRLPGSHAATNTYLPQEKTVYHYSYYYDWVRQQENLQRRCRLNSSSLMELTNKALYIRQPNRLRTFPLRKIKNAEIVFKRLALPLIIGGIVAPLTVLAITAKLANFWLGSAIVLLATTLFYYGWMGGYQITLFFQHHHLSLFVDEKNPNIENMVAAIQKICRDQPYKHYNDLR